MEFDFDVMTEEEIENKIEEIEAQLKYIKDREEACGFDKVAWYEEQDLKEQLDILNSYL